MRSNEDNQRSDKQTKVNKLNYTAIELNIKNKINTQHNIHKTIKI